MSAVDKVQPAVGKDISDHLDAGHDVHKVVQLQDPEGKSPSRTDPVDLLALMAGEPPEEEWIVEPILPARKHVGITARRGIGKSLLALDVVAKRATGKPTLGQPASDPIHIAYLDQEMGPDDLYERLAELGWTVDNPNFGNLVDHLHYYQLVDLPPFDTEQGGRELEAIAVRHNAVLVVIDTISRVVEGEENSNDTYKALFRHTETRLKRRGVALWRLDHFGKDTTKGSRGGSAKEDSLDVVWELRTTDTHTLQLKLTKGRQSWLPTMVTIKREHHNGTLSHDRPVELAPDWLIDLVHEIDELGLSAEAGTPTVQKALRDAGKGRRRSDIAHAVRFRKGRAERVPESVPEPGTPPPEHLREHPGTPTDDKPA